MLGRMGLKDGDVGELFFCRKIFRKAYGENFHYI